MNQRCYSKHVLMLALSIFLLINAFPLSTIKAQAYDIYPYVEGIYLNMMVQQPSAGKQVQDVSFSGNYTFIDANNYHLIVEAYWRVSGEDKNLAINSVFQSDTKYTYSVSVRALEKSSQVPIKIKFIDCENKIEWDKRTELLKRDLSGKKLTFSADFTVQRKFNLEDYNLGDVTIDFTSGNTTINGENEYNAFLNLMYLAGVYDESIIFNYSDDTMPTLDLDKDSNLDLMLVPVYKDGDVNGISFVTLSTNSTSGTYTLELGKKALEALPAEMSSRPEYFYSKATFVISKSTNDKPNDPKDDKTVTEPTKENTPQVNTESAPAQQNKETLDKKQKNAKISKVTAGKKSFTLKWKRVNKGINGYEIQYATDKKFKKNAKIVNIGKSKTTSKKVKGLKSGKSYFVRIRTYKLVDGNKVISNWSTYKKIKVK